MTKIAPRFGVNGDVTIFAGEVFEIALQLQPSLDDDPVELTGRRFAMSAYEQATGTEIASVAADAASEADSVTLAFVGDDTSALFTASLDTALRLMIAELTDDGIAVLNDGALLMCRAPDFAAAAPSPAPSAPYVGVTIVQAANRVQFVERGTPASIALGTVTTGPVGSDVEIALTGPVWARVLNITMPGTDMDSIGFPDGAVPHYAMRIALGEAGVLQAVADAIDADIASAVNIRWTSGAPVKPGDDLADFIQAVTGYTDPEMTSLFAAATAVI